MASEILPAVPDIATIDQREHEQAESVADALELATTMLQALDIDASEIDTSGVTWRGLGVARRIYPKLEELRGLARSVSERCERAIGAYLHRSRSTSVVLAGKPYSFKGSSGTYTYRARELREEMEHYVGTLLTREELDAICPVTVVPEQVIPAHNEHAVDGGAMARLLKKRGQQEVVIGAGDPSEPLTYSFEEIVNQFRSRPTSEPKLKPEVK